MSNENEKIFSHSLWLATSAKARQSAIPKLTKALTSRSPTDYTIGYAGPGRKGLLLATLETDWTTSVVTVTTTGHGKQ